MIDPHGDALTIAWRAHEHGHKVKHFIRWDERSNKIGKGFPFEIVREFAPWLIWADLIINADNTLYLMQLDGHRAKHGTPMISASQESAAWELDREAGMEALRRAGVAVPPYEVFTNYDKAIAYVEARGERCVCKPSNDADKALSYCSKGPGDMIYMLERWKKAGKLKGEWILQDFIPGCEMGVSGWFGPGGFNRGWLENWEFKKLMAGDVGPATGEMGSVLRYVERSKLADLVLRPVEDQLARLKYVGFVDVNCIISDDGEPWPLEFTMRFGWPTWPISEEIHKGDACEWLLNLAQGRDSRAAVLDQVALGVALTLPQFPYTSKLEEVLGVPIQGITPTMAKHIQPCQMMMGEAPVDVGDRVEMAKCPMSAGDYVLIASGCGATVKEAKEAAYRRLRRLRVPSSPMYRTDIGDRLSRQLPKLQAMGFAKSMRYAPT